MSTTVTYKGNTLTTVDNQTRTLLTSGKYMEDDITLVDVSGGGGSVLNVTIQAAMGGLVLYIDDSGTYHKDEFNMFSLLWTGNVPEGNMIITLDEMTSQAALTVTNAILLETISLGNRASYPQMRVFKVQPT